MSSFLAFPGQHTEEAEAALDLRPFAAQMHIAFLFDRMASIDPSVSVESWLMDRAEEKQIPVHTLERPVDVFEPFDSISQERYLLELEELVSLRPTRSEAANARRVQFTDLFGRWSIGDTTDPGPLLAQELCASPDSLAFEPNELQRSIIFDRRESRWIETLDSEISDYERSNGSPTLFVAVGLGHIDPEHG
ncbi:MAG: TraB/GumN family protein [Spirochaetaceae bacterium]